MGLLSNTTVRIVFSQFQTISANWRIADNTEFQFGSDADFNIQFDEANDYLQIDNGSIDILTLSDTRLTLLSDLRLLYTGSIGYLGTIGANSLVLQTSSTNALTIDSSQNVTVDGQFGIPNNGSASDDYMFLGASSQFKLWHDGSFGYIYNTVGAFILENLNGYLRLDAHYLDIKVDTNDYITVRSDTAGSTASPYIMLQGNYYDGGWGVTDQQSQGYMRLISAVSPYITFSIDDALGDGVAGTLSETLRIYDHGIQVMKVEDNANNNPNIVLQGNQYFGGTTNYNTQASLQLINGSADTYLSIYAPISESTGSTEIVRIRNTVFDVISGNLRVPSDTAQFLMGAGSDLQMYYNGTNGYIDLYNGGVLNLRQVSTSANLSTYFNNAYHDIQGEWVIRDPDNSFIHVWNVETGTGAIGIPQDGSSSANFLYVGASEDFKLYHDGGNTLLYNVTGGLSLYNNDVGDVAVYTRASFIVADIDDSNVVLFDFDTTNRTFDIGLSADPIVTNFYGDVAFNDNVTVVAGSRDEGYVLDFTGTPTYKSYWQKESANTGKIFWMSNMYHDGGNWVKDSTSYGGLLSEHRPLGTQLDSEFNFYINDGTGATVNADFNLAFVIGWNTGVGIPQDGSSSLNYLYAGAGKDLKIYHGGSSSTIQNTTGALSLNNSSAGDDIFIQSAGAIYIDFDDDGDGTEFLKVRYNGSTELLVIDETDGVTVDDVVDFGIGTYYEVSTGNASVQGLRNTGLFADTYTSSAIQSIASAPSIRHKQEIDVIFEFYMDNAWTSFTVCAVYLDASVDGGTTWTQVATSTVANGVGNLALLTHDVSANTSLSVSDVNSDLSYRARIVVTGGTGTGSFRVRNYTSAGTVTGTYAVWKRHPTSSDDIWNG